MSQAAETLESPKPSFEAIQEEIATILAIPDEDLTDEDRVNIDRYLDMLANQEAEKIDGFAQFIRLESAAAEAVVEEAKRLSAKGKTINRRIDFLKSRYIEIMQRHNLKKISGKVYTLSMRSSQSVHVGVEAETLPPEYQTVKRVVDPNKTAIKEALKAGKTIHGCTMFDKPYLMIK